MFSDPQAVMPYFGLVDGTTVADFGAGSGHYALAMGERVGDRGRVYAIDIQKELLARLAAEAKRVGVRNLEVVWGNVEKVGGTKLADGLVDFVLVANLLFQTDAKYTLALEARRLLRAGGRLAVVEWSDSFNNLGPRPEAVAGPEAVKKIFAEAGFVFLNDFPAGEHHYGLLFQKP
jgi:ubiquinone/menaquinone biosynthesis C-methylase UbiE